MTIQLKNVFFSYNREPILENVSVEIKQGSFIGIIGPNGGGKTTFLKLILGFLSPQKGSIHLSHKTNVTQSIGYVPQILNLDRTFPITTLQLVLMSEINSISIFGRFKKKTIDKAKSLLEKIGLKDQINMHIKKLSGGQFQKALIARALLSDPDILLLDEPTANIDFKSEKKILDLLISYKTHKTVLMVSHDLQTIIDDVDEIILVQKKVLKKLPDEICEHFALGLYHQPLKK